MEWTEPLILYYIAQGSVAIDKRSKQNQDKVQFYLDLVDTDRSSKIPKMAEIRLYPE